MQVGRKATVAAEDLLVDDGRDWQTVEAVRERLPQLDVEAPLAWRHDGGRGYVRSVRNSTGRQ